MANPIELETSRASAHEGAHERTSGTGFISVSERQPDPQTAVIAVDGELDLSTAPRLKWPLLDSMKAGRTRLLLDLSGVTFIDSTALSVLVAAHRKLPAGARMALVCTNPNVLRIFSVAGIEDSFAIFATADAALAHLRAA
jgi:anti-sigma B factor antagonist